VVPQWRDRSGGSAKKILLIVLLGQYLFFLRGHARQDVHVGVL